MQERKLLHERRSGYAAVGVFVVGAVVFFIWLLLLQRDDTPKYDLSVEFNSINNLSEATLVKLRGFPIGKVKSVDFRPQPAVGEAHFIVSIEVEKKYPVPEGVIAEIRSSGLVGDTFIDLDVSQAGKEALKPGSRIRGRDDIGVKELVENIKDMAHKLGGAGESIRQADLGYRLGRLGDGIHRVAGGMERVSDSTDSLLLVSRILVEQTTPQTAALLGEMQESMARMSGVMGQADTLVRGSRKDVHGALFALRESVEKLNGVLGRVDSLVTLKESQIDSTLDNLHSASESVREISQHPWKIITGPSKKDGE